MFRHYWVLFKLLINVFSTIVLLIYMETFRYMAAVAADPSADLRVVRNPSPALHAVLALLILVIATVLALYKPQGMTPYGWRKQHEPHDAAAVDAAPSGSRCRRHDPAAPLIPTSICRTGSNRQ